ncbi:hypothetical protein GFB56_18525 [Ensifer sp. T173]|uniref:Uncharacterized protein n=1 Tax=Ensifer canadensis TaxID=555315 RepID=A0AAW4FL52_9HYPH|nr:MULTISPECIES: hypothetical protein [Ensifer]KQU84475.1 hypothetical protein ASD00_33165 [Ensifer sp. Root31]KQY76894.1 hypothetical protein ASD52_23095 [Ensifer sp. Root142]MBM3092787.1 hypothetical protein [Ensifer canadensis]NOV19929.1 hypothetical protein [Ensifer canadensis]PSS64255.1 hypothetical protein C6558_11930 [Ensifer sp. NM-2]
MNLEKIGRARMMLRLPAYGRLLSELRSRSMIEIFIAYAEASIQLDVLRSTDTPDGVLIEEYDQICLKIENSIEPYLRMLTEQSLTSHATKETQAR